MTEILCAKRSVVSPVMSWWPLKKHPKKHRGQCDRKRSHQYSEPLSQHQSQQTVPDIVIGGELTPATCSQLEQKQNWLKPSKKTRVPIYHRVSTTSTESEGYGSREASSSSLPHTRNSLSRLQEIPEESKQGTETSPKSLHKNISTASVWSESSTSSYDTAKSNTWHSPTTYLEQLPPEEHSQGVRLEKLEKSYQESKEERHRLERRITELEDRIKMLESQRNVVLYEDNGEKNNKDTLPVNLPIGQNVIIALAKRIPRWKFLARYLEFKEHEIQRIHDEHQGDVQEQCFQMLWSWTQAHPTGGNYHALGEAVRKDLGDSFYAEFVKLVIENEEDCQCTSPC